MGLKVERQCQMRAELPLSDNSQAVRLVRLMAAHVTLQHGPPGTVCSQAVLLLRCEGAKQVSLVYALPCAYEPPFLRVQKKLRP